MRQIWIGIGLVMLATGAIGQPAASGLPSDVRKGHWAEKAVQQTLSLGVLTAQPDKQFHGEAKVTRTQAVMALAQLARTLEEGRWKTQPSKAVVAQVVPILESGDWQQQKVTRYTLATVLARMGNYVANGIKRAPAGSKDTAKSEVLPPATVTLPKTHPAYESLAYLASRRMIHPKSPLLKPNDQPILAAELSHALAEVVVGLNDRLTDMGKDEDGSTPDSASRRRAGGKP